MDTDVLVSFKKLCSQYPNENVDVLWEMAGGDAELARLQRIEAAARKAMKWANRYAFNYNKCFLELEEALDTTGDKK